MSNDPQQVNPPNFDPTRYKQFDDWLPVVFTTDSQTVARFVPARYLDRPTEAERDKAAWRAFALYDHADEMIDHEKMANPQGVKTIADVVAIATAGAIYLNIQGIFFSKWEVSSYPPAISIQANIDTVPVSKDEADDLVEQAHMESVLNRLKPELYDDIKSEPSASWTVWRYIFFSILISIEQDYGPIEKISADEFNRLFESYKESGFSEAFHRATYYCGHYLAYHYLENLNPSQWSLESLMNFLEYEPAEDEDIITGKISLTRIPKLTKLLQGNKAVPIEVAYTFKDGKVFFDIPPLDAGLEDLNKAIAAATATQGGDHRAQWKKELWDDDNLKRYTLLVKKLANDWEWIKPTYEPYAPDSVAWLDDLFTMQVFKLMLDKYPKLTRDLLLRIPDNALSSRDREPVGLACIHAAYELGIMDIYTKNGKPLPPASTLREYYEKGLKLPSSNPSKQS